MLNGYQLVTDRLVANGHFHSRIHHSPSHPGSKSQNGDTESAALEAAKWVGDVTVASIYLLCCLWLRSAKQHSFQL